MRVTAARTAPSAGPEVAGGGNTDGDLKVADTETGPSSNVCHGELAAAAAIRRGLALSNEGLPCDASDDGRRARTAPVSRALARRTRAIATARRSTRRSSTPTELAVLSLWRFQRQRVSRSGADPSLHRRSELRRGTALPSRRPATRPDAGARPFPARTRAASRSGGGPRDWSSPPKIAGRRRSRSKRALAATGATMTGTPPLPQPATPTFDGPGAAWRELHGAVTRQRIGPDLGRRAGRHRAELVSFRSGSSPRAPGHFA